jgi:pimeloyl-ACP methyl ester carboxylesterase
VLEPYPCPTPAAEFVDPAFEALRGARAFFGKYDGGLYQIEVPENWNGELVVYQHGATIGSSIRVQVPVLRVHWIANGYAWAASSFRCNSPAAGIGVIDTNLLAASFSRLTGTTAPTRTWAVGQSNGGGGVLLALRYYPNIFAGGLAMCPADFQTLDYRLAVAAAAEVIGGITLRDSTALSQVTEVFGAPNNYTEKGRQLASVQIELSGGPRPFAVEGLASRFAANIAGGVDNPAVPTTALLRAATNESVQYRIDPKLGFSSDTLNKLVRRQAPDPQLRLRGPHQDTMPFDLKIQHPVVTLHGTGDLTVPITLGRGFKQAADAVGTSHLLVQRIMRIPGHCQFSEQEQIEAFDDLVRWVKEDRRPEGDDIMGDFRDAGRRFTNPLRPGDPGTLTLDASDR